MATTDEHAEASVQHNQTDTHAAVDDQHAEAHAELGAHEPTLFAEPIGQLGPLPVTNSLLTAWIAVAVLVIFSLVLRSRLQRVPRGIQNFFEVIVDGALNMADTITNDRAKTLKFFPIVFALFLFILLNNWMGLLPGIGTVGFIAQHDGHNVLVPFFRGGTADLNTTLALALFAVVGSHIAGVFMIGFWQHLNKFININAIIEIPKKVLKDPTVILVNPIKAFVGLIEIIGEAAKVASLSFRLFGNVFAGEVLLASMAALVAFLVPIPFMFLELIVGIIQALIFAVLTLVYMSIATTAEEH